MDWLPQIKDALGGLTFSKTPAFNHTSLQEAPLSYLDSYGDDRNTTYSADTVAAPTFNTCYARVSAQPQHRTVVWNMCWGSLCLGVDGLK